jgi:hypothetical protein
LFIPIVAVSDLRLVSRDAIEINGGRLVKRPGVSELPQHFICRVQLAVVGLRETPKDLPLLRGPRSHLLGCRQKYRTTMMIRLRVIVVVIMPVV